MWRPCSRCTGYRPILDAFKVFAKAEPHAYTEEAIAASRALANPGPSGRKAEQEPSPAGGAEAPHQAGARAAEANGGTCAAVAMSGAQDAPRLANGNARADADGTAACSPRGSNGNGACGLRPKGGKVAPAAWRTRACQANAALHLFPLPLAHSYFGDDM